MKIIDLLEALPLKTAFAYRKGWNPNTYKEIFSRFPDKDKNAFRIYFHLPNAIIADKFRPAPDNISNYLKSKGFVVDDYLKGIAAVDTDQSRKFRIGRILADNPKLKNEFDSDPKRANVKKKDMLVVISRHPYDIAAMSTNRGWTSCMNLEDGEQRKYIINDIKYGTLVAYVIDNNDRNIQHPISRLLIKPFENEETGDVILYPESNEYGSVVDGFHALILDWCNKINGDKVKGLYCRNPNLYADSPNKSMYHKINDMSDAEQIKIIKKNSYAIKEIDNPSESVQLAAIDTTFDSIKYIKNPSVNAQLAAIKETPYTIQLIKNPSEVAQLAAIKENPKMIMYIQEPTEKAQLYAIALMPSTIEMMKNPSPKAKELAKKSGW